jgi:hypothetical protein
MHHIRIEMYSSKAKISGSVVFVYEIFRGSHPYCDWLNENAPEGKDYLPGDVKNYMPYARVWAYGYQTGFDDDTPLSSAANNFLVYYSEQRQRDSSVSTQPAWKYVYRLKFLR